MKYQLLENEKPKSSNFRIHWDTAQFNMNDVTMYLYSLINFSKHMGWSDHPVTELSTTADKVSFGFIVFGTACSVISNQYAYFLLNRQEAGYSPLKIKLSFGKRCALGLIVSFSVLNKSLAVASSFYALENDYGRPQTEMSVNFVLALLAHLLAQSAVQGVSGNWHAGCNKTLAKILAVVSAGYYTISLMALNWNTLDNVSIAFGWINQRPRIDSLQGIIKLVVIAPFFLPALLLTPVIYFRRKTDRFLSKQDAEQTKQEADTQKIFGRVSRCEKIQNFIAPLAIIQRSGCMLLSLSALLYGLGKSPWSRISMAVVSGVGTIWGTVKSNKAVLHPSADSRERLMKARFGINKTSGDADEDDDSNAAVYTV